MKYLILMTILLAGCDINLAQEAKDDLEFNPPSEENPDRTTNDSEEPGEEPGEEPEEPAIKYADLRKEFLDNKCMGCHGWIGNEEMAKRRIDAGMPERSILYIKIDNGSMPPFGTKVTEEELAKLEKYILQAVN